jgi:hypothetical protein
VALAACTPQPSIVDVSLPTSDPIGAYGFSDPGLASLVLPVDRKDIPGMNYHGISVIGGLVRLVPGCSSSPR